MINDMYCSKDWISYERRTMLSTIQFCYSNKKGLAYRLEKEMRLMLSDTEQVGTCLNLNTLLAGGANPMWLSKRQNFIVELPKPNS